MFIYFHCLTVETSNAVESLHFHMYQSPQLQKGGRFRILEGLRKAYAYYGDLERTSQQISRTIPGLILTFC